MDLEKLQRFFADVDQTTLVDLKNLLFEAAVKYTEIRVAWFFAGEEKKKELSKARTQTHDAFIDACNILSRNMIKSGEKAEWRKELRDNRKDLGDFACFITFMLSVKAR